MKRLLLFLCFGSLVINNVAAQNNKKHIVINQKDDSVDYGKNFLKIILPPIAGISFLNYAINPQVSINPAFLLRGVNGFVCGLFNQQTMNPEALLRSEAVIVGALLIGSTVIKVAEGVDSYFVRPTFKIANSTYNGFKRCVNFVREHKVLSTVGALGISAAVYQLQ